jgi:hypothetical protein
MVMNPLQQMQSMNLGRLLNAPELATINVLEERLGITDATLQQTLSTNVLRAGGKKGAAIVVGEPYFDVVDPNAPNPCLVMSQEFHCLEKPGINYGANGTGISVEQMAIDVLRLFHQTGIQVPAITFWGLRGDPVKYVGGEREIVVTVRGKHDVPMQMKTARPLISGSSGAGVTILSAQGSTVYYTTDGSYPGPGNSTALVYGETVLETQSGVLLETQSGAPLQVQTGNAISVSSGTLVQAVAYAANQQASDLAGLIVS